MTTCKLESDSSLEADIDQNDVVLNIRVRVNQAKPASIRLNAEDAPFSTRGHERPVGIDTFHRRHYSSDIHRVTLTSGVSEISLTEPARTSAADIQLASKPLSSGVSDIYLTDR